VQTAQDVWRQVEELHRGMKQLTGSENVNAAKRGRNATI